ncbi:hypothetical protein GCM10010405_07050 [Streptomyces macrosporus]|uniref:Uncharacterized protein n=1 Tax=Streptomyces macrosporus TaxID=44032 RepID=A0ABP5WH23_9ACTN
MGGVLPGLGSGMARGPYAGRQLGQAVDLPAMCPSGPLGLLDAGPGPGRCVKPSEPTPSHDGAWSATIWRAAGARLADAGAERGEDRSAGPAGSRAARGERQRAALNS